MLSQKRFQASSFINRSTVRLAALAAVVCSLLAATRAVAGGYDWKPVTASDWAVRADSTPGSADAVALFTRVEANDEDLADGECRRLVYDRIRILSAQGRKFADVEVTYRKERDEIDDISARSIHPDGSVTVMRKESIRDLIAVADDETEFRKCSFSIPGVTADCIIEYSYVVTSKKPESEWVIQREIPVLHAELEWKFFRPTLHPFSSWRSAWAQLYTIDHFLVPNFHWLNAPSSRSYKLFPSDGAAETALFTIDSIPALIPEPEMQPATALKSKLLYFYGGNQSVDQYWAEEIGHQRDLREEFCKNDSLLAPKIAEFSAIPSASDKVRAAFDWIQSTYTTPAYRNRNQGSKEPKDHESVNDVMKRGNGTPWQLNMMYWDLLNKLNVSCGVAYVVDRNLRNFVADARYDQFEGTLVALEQSGDEYSFYAPGYTALAPRYAPIFAQGTMAMVSVGSNRARFALVQFTPADSNKIVDRYTLAMSENGELSGTVRRKLTGLAARDFRFASIRSDNAERINLVEKSLKESIDGLTVDSIAVEMSDTSARPVTITAHVRFPMQVQNADNILITRPTAAFGKSVTMFTAEHRQHPILFDYAYRHKTELILNLPSAYRVMTLMPDTNFSNGIGSCRRISFEEDSVVTVNSEFCVELPSAKVESYDSFRRLFRTRQDLGDAPLVLEARTTPSKDTPQSGTRGKKVGGPRKKAVGKK